LGTRRKLRFAWIALSSLMLLVTSCTAIGVSDQSSDEVVVIAADLELTGDGAALGAIYRNALELRVDQVNERGLLGNRVLELDIRDNRTDPTTSMANLTDFAADDSVAAIITGGCAACVLAGLEIINDAGVPTISLAGPEDVASPAAERRYVFKLGPNPKDSASALMAELGRADARTVALLASDDAYGNDGLEELAALAEVTDIEIALQKLVPDDEEAMRSAVDEIAAFEVADEFPTILPGTADDGTSSLDAVVIWAYFPLASVFAVDLRDAGFEGPLFLDPAAADDLFLTGATARALADATLIFTETFVIDQMIATSPAAAARKTWFNDYSARYGTYHAFASFAADAIDLVVNAINRVDSTDRELIRGIIERTQMDGLSGPIRLTPDNHSGLTSLALTTLVVRGDRWRPAS
jgi:branched-chain amino acid transport system substrate-binding protein